MHNHWRGLVLMLFRVVNLKRVCVFVTKVTNRTIEFDIGEEMHVEDVLFAVSDLLAGPAAHDAGVAVGRLFVHRLHLGGIRT